MTSTPETALPDEDLLELPAAWRRYAMPRRGDATPSRLELDPDHARNGLDLHGSKLRELLSQPGNAEFAEAGESFLDGDPEPTGAAAVATLLATVDHRYSRGLRPQFDLVHDDHGLPVAVAAAVESMSLRADNPRAEEWTLRRDDQLNFGWHWYRMPKDIAAVRALVAAAPSAVYSEVVRTLNEHRDSPVKLMAASVLVPYETAWLDEACAEMGRVNAGWAAEQQLLGVITTIEQWRKLGEPTFGYSVGTAEAASLVDRLGADALPVLAADLAGHRDAADSRLLLRLVGTLPSDDAMGYLVDYPETARSFSALTEAARRFPRRVLRSVAARIDGSGEDRRRLFTAVALSDPMLVDEALPMLEGSEQAAVRELLAGDEAVPSAPASALPPLLVSPPWAGGRTERKAAVVDGLEPPAINRIVWAEGERERWAAETSPWGEWRWSFGPEQSWNEVRTRGNFTKFFAYMDIEEARPRLADWDGDDRLTEPEDLMRILARFELDAADQVVEVVKRHSNTRAAILPLVNLRTARLAADSLRRLKSARATAVEWLERHAEDAAALLIPDALGKHQRARGAAEAALARIVAARGPEPVLRAAADHGDQALDAIRALTERDPLDPVGVKIPDTGTWAVPAVLPQVLLRGREQALPPASVAHLITVLAIAAPEHPYPGVDVVAEVCDPDSLARFSWALFEQWLNVGAPSKASWALTQLAAFADDDTVRDLTPLIREWPGQNQHKRAVAGLGVLGAIGSESALRAIHRISQKVKFRALKAEAASQIESIAGSLGLTTEQLADRLVPDFGLDDDSALVLDYGPRRFQVRFDEQLKPFVTDMDGRPRKSLPKPGAKDDAELAAASKKRFSNLKKDLRTVAADQVKRLEQAMIDGRTWTVEEFRRYFVDHPLVWHLTQRLVWLAESGGEATAFRLAEDRTFTDVEEDELKLPEDARVRLAHPALLEGQVAAWAEILADYEILQPFDQLSRPVMRFTDEELRSGSLARFEGVEVPVGKLLGLTKKGWERAAPEDAGVEPGMSRAIPGVGYVVLTLDPGIAVGMVDEWPEQTLESVRLTREERYRYRGTPEPARMDPIDPVLSSEILAALTRITKSD